MLGHQRFNSLFQNATIVGDPKTSDLIASGIVLLEQELLGFHMELGVVTDGHADALGLALLYAECATDDAYISKVHLIIDENVLRAGMKVEVTNEVRFDAEKLKVHNSYDKEAFKNCYLYLLFLKDVDSVKKTAKMFNDAETNSLFIFMSNHGSTKLKSLIKSEFNKTNIIFGLYGFHAIIHPSTNQSCKLSLSTAGNMCLPRLTKETEHLTRYYEYLSTINRSQGFTKLLFKRTHDMDKIKCSNLISRSCNILLFAYFNSSDTINTLNSNQLARKLVYLLLVEMQQYWMAGQDTGLLDSNFLPFGMSLRVSKVILRLNSPFFDAALSLCLFWSNLRATGCSLAGSEFLQPKKGDYAGDLLELGSMLQMDGAKGRKTMMRMLVELVTGEMGEREVEVFRREVDDLSARGQFGVINDLVSLFCVGLVPFLFLGGWFFMYHMIYTAIN